MRTGTDTLITIRKLHPADKQFILQLLKETNVFTRHEIDVAEEVIDAYLNDSTQQDYDIYEGITEHREIAGYVCFGPIPLTDGTFDVYWIAVRPIFQGQHIGKQLLQYVERLVIARGGRLLLAETSSQPHYERSKIFYTRNNYREVTRIKDYYRIDDDLIIYGKYLSQSKGS
ncbi:MAG: GNAT family N-acetyltransferase [Ignavibacteriae bacterium]|nr:GNAT family N-acetyltransferase [Ignavibacteriota bacterium]